MAVVKADAYGHGAVECARRLETEGAEWFAVATLEEAAELREAGISRPVLCLGGLYPGQEDTALHLRITPAVFTVEAAERLDRAAGSRGERASVHVKIDTGMGRVGVPFGEVEDFARRLRLLENLELEALMTHFVAADDPSEDAFTNLQTDRLKEAAATFRDLGFSPSFIDLANSPGAVAHPSTRADMVRVGGVLYGLARDVLPVGLPRPELKPVLSLHSRLAQVKRVPAGTSIGYGRSFVTNHGSVIGTIPIGYHDGFPRGLSGVGRAIVNGTIVPVVGIVSMDWTTLDLTSVHDASVGDEVILIGREQGLAIAAEDLAEDLGTISYEITCGLSARVPRRYASGPTA